MRLAVLQHVPFEGAGAIKNWADERGYTVTNFLAENGFPNINDFDMLAVMGGPMGVYQTQQYPWIDSEKAFLQACIDAQKPIIGFCLGAQFLAAVLGSQVYKGDNGREIGYWPLDTATTAANLAVPAVTNALHWHGDTFELPVGAKRLYSSAAYSNQGFIYNDRVIGLQFHWEIETSDVEALLSKCADELSADKWVQSATQIRSGSHDGLPALFAYLDYLTGYV